MPFDLQIVQAQALLPTTDLRVIPGLDPPTLEIRGGPFDVVEEVLVNGNPSPSVVVSSPNRVLAQLPEDALSNIRTVEVVGPTLFGSDDVLYRFRLGAQPRLVQGLPKLIQTFVRLLLQTPGTSLLNKDLGGGLLQVLRAPVRPGDEKALISAAYTAVRKTADDLLVFQTRTSDLPRSERLGGAEVREAGVSAGKLVLGIRLQNQIDEAGKTQLRL